MNSADPSFMNPGTATRGVVGSDRAMGYAGRGDNDQAAIPAGDVGSRSPSNFVPAPSYPGVTNPNMGGLNPNDPLYGKQNAAITAGGYAEAQARHQREHDANVYTQWAARQKAAQSPPASIPAPANGALPSFANIPPTSAFGTAPGIPVPNTGDVGVGRSLSVQPTAAPNGAGLNVPAPSGGYGGQDIDPTAPNYHKPGEGTGLMGQGDPNAVSQRNSPEFKAYLAKNNADEQAQAQAKLGPSMTPADKEEKVWQEAYNQLPPAKQAGALDAHKRVQIAQQRADDLRKSGADSLAQRAADNAARLARADSNALIKGTKASADARDKAYEEVRSSQKDAVDVSKRRLDDWDKKNPAPPEPKPPNDHSSKEQWLATEDGKKAMADYQTAKDAYDKKRLPLEKAWNDAQDELININNQHNKVLSGGRKQAPQQFGGFKEGVPAPQPAPQATSAAPWKDAQEVDLGGTIASKDNPGMFEVPMRGGGNRIMNKSELVGRIVDQIQSNGGKVPTAFTNGFGSRESGIIGGKLPQATSAIPPGKEAVYNQLATAGHLGTGPNGEPYHVSPKTNTWEKGLHPALAEATV